MKKVLILMCVIATVMLASCGYSKEDLNRAEERGYHTGFEEGYDLAKHEAKGELERSEQYMDNAYEAGYERGYEEGYDDCLEEHGLVEESTFNPNDPPRIKKDK